MLSLSWTNEAAVRAWLNEKSQSPRTALRMLPLLYSVVPRTNQIRPSLAKLAEDADASEEEVTRILEELESIGVVFRREWQEGDLFLHPDILHHPDALEEDARDAAPELAQEVTIHDEAGVQCT